MKTRTLTLLVILAQLTAARPARAQEARAADTTLLTIGSRVRIEAPGILDGRVQGSVSALDEDAVTVVLEGRSPLVIPRAAIQRLEVGLGRRKNRRLGMLVGALAGAAFGAVMPVDPERCGSTTLYQSTYVAQVDDSHFCSRAEAVGSSVLVFGLLGYGIGVPTESWGPVRFDEARLGVYPTRGGVGASVQIRF